MTQSYGGPASGATFLPKKMSTSMAVLAACMIGVVVGLLGLNYWHTSGCANSRSPDEMEIYIEGISRRLLQAESQTIKNGLVMEKLLNSLQSKLVKLEMSELSEITKFSQDEAVRLTLMLAAQPAPPMPEFQLDPIYQDADKLADAIDDVFSTTGDKDDYEVEEKKKWEEFDDYDDKVKKKDVDEKDKAMTLTDAEATAICTDWMIKYSVVQGVSWGNLPFDLQQKWLSYSCDYHFGKINSPTPTLYPASPPSFESVY